jgi:enoyl-CoA hydratase
MEDELLYEIQDNVAYVTFNRPQARNALTKAMYDSLMDICKRAGADDSVRVMVLRGAGEKAFASGADIAQFTEMARVPGAGTAYQQTSSDLIDALEAFPKPLIAAINGACAGGGVGIAATCDLRVGTATTRIGVPIAKTLGNCISRSTLVRLASIIGSARSLELIFTARLISGAEAKEWGFLNEIVDTAEQLNERVRELAKHVAGMAPLTLRATKEQIRRLRDAQMSRVNFDDLTEMCFSSDDFKNAVNSFVAKQPPVWTGR